MKEDLKRTLISKTPQAVDQEVLIKGWVQRVRTHGKLVFMDVRDRTGAVQVIVNAKTAPEAFETAQDLRAEFAIQMIGKVNKRPENAINKDLITGTIEVEALALTVLAAAEVTPFDTTKKTLHLELPTLLDHRSLTLKHPSVQDIFMVQATLAEEFRNAAKELDCVEVFVPTIAAGATEGGAEVFPIGYYGHKAFLTQSPQLYKQIMVGVLERVFTIAKAYRAEPSVTTMHLAESTQMDIEMGFIDSFGDLLDALEFVGTTVVKNTAEKHTVVFERFGIEKPLVAAKVPRLKLREAQEIIKERTGRDLSKEMDLNREDEVEIWKWARETHNSDFVTITHFPTKKRAFYTYPDPENPEYSLSYDLIFKGLEILSGSQRIHDYNQLIEAMEKKGVNPKNFGMYLQAFRYGVPPEGGFSFGLERLTMKLLDLANVREASLFPRDMERVDERFSVTEEVNKE